MENVYLTKEGLNELQAKLDDLVANKRIECAEKIKQAREFGDLSENAEYDAAKEEQSFVEAEIKDIEEKIRHAVIIDEKKGKTIHPGSTIVVMNMNTNVEAEYKIVGSTEANLKEGKISNESPLGMAVFRKKKGDIVDVQSPNGNIIQYKIVAIVG